LPAAVCALSWGDVEEIAALVDEHVRWHSGDPDAPWACHNRRQALAFIVCPDRRGAGELVDVIDAGDRVVVITQPPAEDDGKPRPLHAQITTFRDGGVVEMVAWESVQAALRAADVSRTAPGG
jgi:ketosteroid isomerase-like protein